MLYRHELLLQCVHQIFEHEYTRATDVWLYWVETAFLSVEQCLAAFAWASCCLIFIITSGTSESRFHIYLNTITILLSVAVVPFLSLWDSLSPFLWNLSLGVFLRFLHSLTLRERSPINPYLHFHCSLDERAMSASAYACIICMYGYVYIIHSFNKKSLKYIESKRLGHYQIHRRRFFFGVPMLLLDLGVI